MEVGEPIPESQEDVAQLGGKKSKPKRKTPKKRGGDVADMLEPSSLIPSDTIGTVLGGKKKKGKKGGSSNDMYPIKSCSVTEGGAKKRRAHK